MRKFKKFLHDTYYLIIQFGFNPLKLIHTTKGIIPFIKDYKHFKSQQKNSDTTQFKFKLLPSFGDRFDSAGTLSGHYFYQDLLVANKLFNNNPKKHVDIGSSVSGFVAHVASYRQIEFFDVRELECLHPNIISKKVDLTNIDNALTNYCDSISSLHAIEHFGLGRYGDPIDFDGHVKGINNIHKILQENGTFYFSVPIGPQRIEFNSHRVFDLGYLLDIFKDKFSVKSFSYINDAGKPFTDIELTDDLINNNCHCQFGCGIFELTKISSSEPQT